MADETPDAESGTPEDWTVYDWYTAELELFQLVLSEELRMAQRGDLIAVADEETDMAWLLEKRSIEADEGFDQVRLNGETLWRRRISDVEAAIDARLSDTE